MAAPDTNSNREESMFSSVRRRLRVSPAGTIAVIALVFALGGGAFAASGDDSGDSGNAGGAVATGSEGAATATDSKVKRGPRGPKGKPGPAGPAGPAGPSGPAGPKGDVGPKGDTGAPGGAGPAGTSVTSSPLDPGEEGCVEGGTKFVAGTSVTQACNGEAGGPGADGSPWVVGQAPSGVLMKGTWALPQYTAVAAAETFPIAFSTGVPISTTANVTGVYVPIAEQANPAAINGCIGTAEAPVAENNGIMCIYEALKSGGPPPAGEGVSVNLAKPSGLAAGQKVRASGGGIVILAKSVAAGPVSGYGSWALRTPGA